LFHSSAFAIGAKLTAAAREVNEISRIEVIISFFFLSNFFESDAIL